MNYIINWLISAVAIGISAYILPGVAVAGLFVAIVTALVLGLINAFIRPLVIFLTLPINILTLGLFTLVINASLVLLAGKIVPGFMVDGFWWALIFSLVLALVNMALEPLRSKIDSPKDFI
jgi:putative membrane protein